MSTQSSNNYSIKEASQLTGLPSSTLRYYESIGIIEPIERNESSKQRVYNQQNIDLLDSIACLNATGMPLDDMREYISHREGGADAADVEIGLLQTQEHRLTDEMESIKVRQKYVALKVRYWNAVKLHDDAKAEMIAREAKEVVKDLKKL